MLWTHYDCSGLSLGIWLRCLLNIFKQKMSLLHCASDSHKVIFTKIDEEGMRWVSVRCRYFMSIAPCLFLHNSFWEAIAKQASLLLSSSRSLVSRFVLLADYIFQQLIISEPRVHVPAGGRGFTSYMHTIQRYKINHCFFSGVVLLHPLSACSNKLLTLSAIQDTRILQRHISAIHKIPVYM